MAALITKSERKLMLAEQNNQCALCGYAFGPNQQNCYDAAGHTLVCRACLLLLSAFRNATARIGEDVLAKLVEYMESHRGRPV